MTRPSGNKSQKKATVRFYRFRNKMREKAGGTNLATGPSSFARESFEAAEQEFEKAAEDYPDWVQGIITRLYEQHGRCVDTPESREPVFKTLSEIAHDLKGQGGTFGYNLISHFGASLYIATRPREDYEDSQVEIIKAHIDAMRAVIKGRIKGDGGDIGVELTKTLDAAIEKYTTLS